MKTPPKLALIFVEYARERVVAPDELEKLEELLQGAYETGRTAWPQVALSPEVFVRYLAQLWSSELGTGGALVQTLDQKIKATDIPGLYLACACIHAVPFASEVLERDFLARLRTLLDPRMSATTIDEICQLVRIHLLLGTKESGPRLAVYKGQGSLLNWILVIATRMGLKQVTPARKNLEENDLMVIEALPAPGLDAEFDLIRRRCLHEFRPTVREAFATLSPKQRYQLRLHFLDRLSTIQIGKLYGVDQSTVSRWLKSARQAIYEETKRRLKERLRVSSNEFDSILSDINSQLTLSLSQVLKEEEEEKLRQAVRDAVATLPIHQRRLLRRHLVDRLSLNELSQQSGEELSTVSLWLESARKVVYEEAKGYLLVWLGPLHELENRLGDLHIQIDLSLYHVLKEQKGED
jgi:RNA polymerase sigma-70 factor